MSPRPPRPGPHTPPEAGPLRSRPVSPSRPQTSPLFSQPPGCSRCSAELPGRHLCVLPPSPDPVPLGVLFQPQGRPQPRTCLAGAHRKSGCYSLKPQETTDDVLCQSWRLYYSTGETHPVRRTNTCLQFLKAHFFTKTGKTLYTQ